MQIFKLVNTSSTKKSYAVFLVKDLSDSLAASSITWDYWLVFCAVEQF